MLHDVIQSILVRMEELAGKLISILNAIAHLGGMERHAGHVSIVLSC